MAVPGISIVLGVEWTISAQHNALRQSHHITKQQARQTRRYVHHAQHMQHEQHMLFGGPQFSSCSTDQLQQQNCTNNGPNKPWHLAMRCMHGGPNKPWHLAMRCMHGGSLHAPQPTAQCHCHRPWARENPMAKDHCLLVPDHRRSQHVLQQSGVARARMFCVCRANTALLGLGVSCMDMKTQQQPELQGLMPGVQRTPGMGGRREPVSCSPSRRLQWCPRHVLCVGIVMAGPGHPQGWAASRNLAHPVATSSVSKSLERKQPKQQGAGQKYKNKGQVAEQSIEGVLCAVQGVAEPW